MIRLIITIFILMIGSGMGVGIGIGIGIGGPTLSYADKKTGSCPGNEIRRIIEDRFAVNSSGRKWKRLNYDQFMKLEAEDIPTLYLPKSERFQELSLDAAAAKRVDIVMEAEEASRSTIADSGKIFRSRNTRTGDISEGWLVARSSARGRMEAMSALSAESKGIFERMRRCWPPDCTWSELDFIAVDPKTKKLVYVDVKSYYGTYEGSVNSQIADIRKQLTRDYGDRVKDLDSRPIHILVDTSFLSRSHRDELINRINRDFPAEWIDRVHEIRLRGFDLDEGY